ncbi:MAG: Na+/H+ antiporter NhaC family protein [Opitutales bacterium]
MSDLTPPIQPWRKGCALLVFLATFGLVPLHAIEALDLNALHALWPTVVALSVVLLLRRAIVGLLAGAVAGAILLAEGDPWQAYLTLAADHFAPIFDGPWRVGAIAFTLMMGGFAGVIEKGGGLIALFNRLQRTGGDASKRLQLGSLGLGLVCFFDGLANSMLVGRITRNLARPCGVSRVKLAYIVDSTSAAVACIAFFSTWIAAQLAYISEGFARLQYEGNAYLYFFGSIPLNFYCWFTLVLVAVSAWKHFNPGPMSKYEAAAQAAQTAYAVAETRIQNPVTPSRSGALASAFAPLVVLILAMPAGFYFLGLPEADPQASYFPLTQDKITGAFGSNAGPLVLILASLAATLAAFAFWPWKSTSEKPTQAYADGAKALLPPVGILLSAWLLGNVLGALGANEIIASVVSDNLPIWSLPAAIFVTGAFIAFSTGTSWGTMGILTPLAIEVVGLHPGLVESAAGAELLFSAAVAAVFSGAVFGDHCSPISDTTVVSAIATDVEPVDHVKTQMPFALIAAFLALVVGFLPAGLGLPGWLLLPLGIGVLLALPVIFRGARTPSPPPATV